MEEILKSFKDFEDRNNISVVVEIYSDGQNGVTVKAEEFWQGEILFEGKQPTELKKFLDNTEYKKSENGLCLSPVQKIDQLDG